MDLQVHSLVYAKLIKYQAILCGLNKIVERAGTADWTADGTFVLARYLALKVWVLFCVRQLMAADAARGVGNDAQQHPRTRREARPYGKARYNAQARA